MLLNAVAATGQGSPLYLPSWRWALGGPQHKMFLITVTNTATVKIEFRGEQDDPSTGWRDLSGASFTATGAVGNSDPMIWIAANVTAWTSGTVTVELVF